MDYIVENNEFILPSNKRNEEHLLTFKDIVNSQKEKFTGYKILRYSGGNYYSVTTGMFRYKPRFIDCGPKAYSHIYDDTSEYEGDMVGKTAIFHTKEDAIKMFGDLLTYDNIHLVELTIDTELIEGVCSNKHGEARFVAGRNLIHIKKAKV